MTSSAPDHDVLAGLVRRAQAGDADAFRRLLGEVHGRVYRWALGLTGEPDEADDVAQAVLLKLHRHLSAYRGRGRLTTWLYRITRNEAGQRERQRRRRRALLEERTDALPAAYEPAAPIDARRLAALVHARFRQLPERQREVFDLVDLQGYAPAEVAEMLGTTPVTVRTNLLRARRAIRGWILESHPELVEEYRS
ncbi:MAG TPA: RNA polymerase sigma factor [Longimicrobiales bacterium]